MAPPACHQGRKSLVVSELSSVGSDDSLLGVVNIVFGSVALVCAVVVFVQDKVCPRFVAQKVRKMGFELRV